MKADNIAVPDDPAPHGRSDQRFVWLSIGGLWALYIGFVALRVTVIIFPHKAALIGRHGATAATGALLTLCFHLVLRRWSDRSLASRLAVAALLAFVPASILSVVNYDVMFVFDPAGLWSADERQNVSLLGIATQTMIENYLMFMTWAALTIAVESATQEQHARRRAAVMEVAAREAELRALRYQLNPHFLFNALNTISALVLEGHPDQAEGVIAALSGFLRMTLAMDAMRDVTLEDEIRMQRLYLDIEQIRFGTRLTVRIDVPDHLRAVLVPALVLQPLTENVIRHAVARISRPVTLDVRARREAETLHLVVEDDGPGGSDAGGSGVGLQNVASRLATRFGGRGRCVAGPREAGGFRVALALPLLAGQP